MTFIFSNKAQIIKVYNYLVDTKEYIGSGDVYISPNMGLPANCTNIEPPEIPAGFVAAFDRDKDAWQLVADYRGQTVYNTETGKPECITALGDLPDNVTEIAPVGEFQKWNGSEWVTDEDARQAAAVNDAVLKRDSLRASADAAIAWLSDAVEAGIATAAEIASLAQWKTYRVQLMRINPADAEAIVWPPLPGEANDVEV